MGAYNCHILCLFILIYTQKKTNKSPSQTPIIFIIDGLLSVLQNMTMNGDFLIFTDVISSYAFYLCLTPSSFVIFNPAGWILYFLFSPIFLTFCLYYTIYSHI